MNKYKIIPELIDQFGFTMNTYLKYITKRNQLKSSGVDLTLIDDLLFEYGNIVYNGIVSGKIIQSMEEKIINYAQCVIV